MIQDQLTSALSTNGYNKKNILGDNAYKILYSEEKQLFFLMHTVS